MKTSNKEKVMEFAKTYKRGETHWDEFVKSAKAATGAKVVREAWIQAIGAKKMGIDEEYLKANYKSHKNRLCPKAPEEYTWDAMQNSVLWIFG